jgi:hypothetical protein
LISRSIPTIAFKWRASENIAEAQPLAIDDIIIFSLRITSNDKLYPPVSEKDQGLPEPNIEIGGTAPTPEKKCRVVVSKALILPATPDLLPRFSLSLDLLFQLAV